jgi:ribosomal protein L16 Arg81 hydroxylase
MSKPLATLADLVSPLTEPELLGLLRRRELAYRPGANGDRYAPVLGWSALRSMIEAGNYSEKRRDDIKVTKETVAVAADRWMTKGKVDAAKLDAFLANGFSIVMLHLDEHVPALGAVCEEIKSRTLEGSLVGAVVTSGAGAGAFPIHYDPEDLVILQVEGTKRWQIFGPPVSQPLRGMPKQSPPETEPIFDEVLEPGDLLFVPGGNWHHCESGLSTSVHLGIFFLPPTAWHVAKEALRPLLSEELFRTPLTRLDGGGSAVEEIEAEVKSRLIERIGELKLNAFIAEWSKMAY